MNMFVLRSGFWVDSGAPRVNASGKLGLREILPGVPPVGPGRALAQPSSFRSVPFPTWASPVFDLNS